MNMKRRLPLWRTLGSIMVLLCFGLILAAYRFGWAVTGFPGKTLWDWLQLLIVPFALSLVALFFSQANTHSERQIALNRQQQEILQSYLDHMSELLLEKNLRTSSSTEVRNIARTLTISVLTQIDARRVGYVFNFLRETGLIDASNPIISLSQAEFGWVDWRSANLSGVDLSGANLHQADLTAANLSGVNFRETNLSDAMFYATKLNRADLSYANLSNAFINYTDLSSANLSNANLKRAFLTWTNFSQADLSGADLSDASIRNNVNFKGANLHGAKVDRSRLTSTQITDATF